jgi:hypothetical protein
MPIGKGQTQQSSFFNRMGKQLAKVAADNKAKEPEVDSFDELPAPINNGVARLVKCQFQFVKDGENKGKDLLYAEAVIVPPTNFKGQPVTGRIRHMESIYETSTGVGDAKKTVTAEQHFAQAQDFLKTLLAIPGLEKFNPDDVDLPNIERTMARLVKEKPYVKFRTWKGDKQVIQPIEVNGKKRYGLCTEVLDSQGVPTGDYMPAKGRGGMVLPTFATEAEAKRQWPFAGRDSRTQHVWQGKCLPPAEVAEPGDGVNDGDDQTASNGEVTSGDDVDRFDTEPDGGEAAASDEFGGDEGETDWSQSTDLAALLAQAEVDADDDTLTSDSPAMLRLRELGEEAGLDAEFLNAEETTWSQIAQAVEEAQNKQGESSEEEESDEEEPEEEAVEEEEEPEPPKPVGPKVRAVYYYTPMGADKKPGKRMEVKIVSVDEEKQTCTVANVTTGKPVVGANKKPVEIKWSKLVKK